MSRATRALGAGMLAVALVGLTGCSPEATRRRDGGPGADPGNTNLVMRPSSAPVPADTTLWPGRAPTPVERLTSGVMPLPSGVSSPVRARTPESKSR